MRVIQRLAEVALAGPPVAVGVVARPHDLLLGAACRPSTSGPSTRTPARGRSRRFFLAWRLRLTRGIAAPTSLQPEEALRLPAVVSSAMRLILRELAPALRGSSCRDCAPPSAWRRFDLAGGGDLDRFFAELVRLHLGHGAVLLRSGTRRAPGSLRSDRSVAGRSRRRRLSTGASAASTAAVPRPEPRLPVSESAGSRRRASGRRRASPRSPSSRLFGRRRRLRLARLDRRQHHHHVATVLQRLGLDHGRDP